jgi:hypothetical protein
MKERSIYFLPVVIVILLVARCGEPQEFHIEGEFTQKDPTPVRLYLLDEDGTQLVDSTFAADKLFSVSEITSTTNIFMISFFNDQQIYLVIRPHDKIGLTIDNTQDELAYYVTDSPDSKYIKELTDKQNQLLKQIDQLTRMWESRKTDTLTRRKVDSTYFALVKEHQTFTREFIYSHPQSLANIMALYQNVGKMGRQLFDRYEDLDIFNFVDSCLSAVYPQTYSVLALNRDLSEIREQIAQKTYIEKEVETGFPLPRLNTQDIHGDTIVIDDSEDRYKLIIFWATWNPYSVNELLHINRYMEANPKVRDRLKVICFSLDTSREHLNTFLSENKLDLSVICDFRYWDSDFVARYAIKRIPATILADRKNMVLARDIFSNELITKLNETIK